MLGVFEIIGVIAALAAVMAWPLAADAAGRLIRALRDTNVG
jgi:hypothetical protein